MQRSALVHTGHHLIVSAVEAVHPDYAGLGLHVGIVRVGGVQVVLKHSQAVQVLNLEGGIPRVLMLYIDKETLRRQNDSSLWKFHK